jgi:hypothetical protein
VAYKKGDDNDDNLEKLSKAGILPAREKLTPQDTEVIESLTREEVDAWVRIKEKLDKAGVREQECKFYI